MYTVLWPYTICRPNTKTKINRTSGQTHRRSVFFFLHVAIRNSLRSNKTLQIIKGCRVSNSRPTYMPIKSKPVHCCIHASLFFFFVIWMFWLWSTSYHTLLFGCIKNSSISSKHVPCCINLHTNRAHNLHGRVDKQKGKNKNENKKHYKLEHRK